MSDARILAAAVGECERRGISADRASLLTPHLAAFSTPCPTCGTPHDVVRVVDRNGEPRTAWDAVRGRHEMSVEELVDEIASRDRTW